MFDIKQQLKQLPLSPGVYIMKDESGDIIYIGKSKSLKKRVSQYFQKSDHKLPKVQAMVKTIREFEYIITDTEAEALILEANLIKKHRPRYNVSLKDDKNYPYIKVTVNEKYPRVFKTRKVLKDNAKYFGPYISAFAVDKMLEAIHDNFPIRRCKRKITDKVERPCLNYHIGKCIGPCKHKDLHPEYMELVDQILLLLNGRHDNLVKELNDEMQKASEDLNFEKAMKLRDRINSILNLNESQKIISTDMKNQDYIAMARGSNNTCVSVFFIRNGKMLGRENHIIDETDVLDRSSILNEFIKQFYSRSEFTPKEIYVDEEIADKDLIESWLTQKSNSKVMIKKPVKGDKKKTIEMVHRNALEYLTKFEEKIIREKTEFEEAIGKLKMIIPESSLERIEAYDISNIYGVYSVGSMVVFQRGKAQNSAYRKFRIKTIEGPNDYGSMQEVVFRRFSRGKKELEDLEKQGIEGKFSIFPDLMLIDGGKGQVNAVLEVINAMNIDIPVAGMIKDDRHRTRGLIYKGNEYVLDRTSKEYRLIAKIQEEVHRFAISYHKSIRDKALEKSALDEIKGVGKTRKKALLKSFGSINKIKKASTEELLEVDSINENVAREIYNYFREKKGNKNEYKKVTD